MARPDENDLRTRILEDLMQRVRKDQFPSMTMLNMIEAMLHNDDVEEYANLLFDKVGDETYPSMDLLRRLQSLV